MSNFQTDPLPDSIIEMRVKYKIVDVFSSKPLGGNALCVVLDECPEHLMQQIAREVNLSETTFPVVTSVDSYKMRIFTTATEFPFAGHPSLGTAWTLGPQTWTQVTSGATVLIHADEKGASMTQPTPRFSEVDRSKSVGESASVEIESTVIAENGGMKFLIARTSQPLAQVNVSDTSAYDALNGIGASGLAVCRINDKSTVEVRVFFPGDSVFEDPGTGSLAGPLGLYAHSHWGVNKNILVKQGEFVGRPCEINVDVDGNDVRVGG